MSFVYYNPKKGEKPMSTLGERIKKSWNVFIGREPVKTFDYYGYSTSTRPERPRLTRGRERSMINSIYNRIAVDVSQTNIKHVVVDVNGRYQKDKEDSGLNEVLTTSANLDQTGRALIQDAVISMFDEGCVALVPIETSESPDETDSYKIYSMRTGKILEWFPKHVKVSLYDERTGKRKDLMLKKEDIAIIENPFYAIMNEPNSTLQRLIRILNDIDRTNDYNAAGKMDLIIQLPYLTRSDNKKKQAEERRKLLENQLTGSQYGIGYIDATEKIVQLNRSIENNLWQEAQDLKKDVYAQLGLTENIFNGTANEQEQLDYYTRTVEPILVAITEELTRKFLTKTARTQGQKIMYFREPFKLVPINNIADIADRFTRNEVLSSNEIRSIIGFKPDSNPKSDQLVNSNMPIDQTGYGAEAGAAPGGEIGDNAIVNEQGEVVPDDTQQMKDQIVNEVFDNIESQIQDIISNYLKVEENEEEE